MNGYFQSSASRPRLPSIKLGSSLNNFTRMASATASSSTFSINQNYNSIVGSMKSLFKENNEGDNNEITSKSQIILPKIGEHRNSLPGNSLKQGIRKSKSENAVNSAKKSRNGSLKAKFPPKEERKGSLSAPLGDINEHEYFGSTLPPRSLLKKAPLPAKEQEQRMEKFRKDIVVTGDTFDTSNGVNSMKQRELSISTTKDGKEE